MKKNMFMLTTLLVSGSLAQATQETFMEEMAQDQTNEQTFMIEMAQLKELGNKASGSDYLNQYCEQF